MFDINTKAVQELTKHAERVAMQAGNFARNIATLEEPSVLSEDRRAIVLDMASQIESMRVNVGWMADELFRISAAS